MTTLFLRYPFEPWGDKMTLVMPRDCESIQRMQNGGACVTMKGLRYYLPEWRVDYIASQEEIAEEPEAYACKTCGKNFPSAHALKTHAGMAHRFR